MKSPWLLLSTNRQAFTCGTVRRRNAGGPSGIGPARRCCGRAGTRYGGVSRRSASGETPCIEEVRAL
ncbi:hypothetical protein, partial [uncultured Fretibacterium sp.]|uniref:hypothetical protein n=1 Tax=uncultured Fretibacterium sp. TaxID=1678694 RepID=UPI0026034E05